MHTAGPDDNVDELDFSVSWSTNFRYDDLADLSLTLDDSDEEVAIDISNAREVEDRSIAQFAEGGVHL